MAKPVKAKFRVTVETLRGVERTVEDYFKVTKDSLGEAVGAGVTAATYFMQQDQPIRMTVHEISAWGEREVFAQMLTAHDNVRVVGVDAV